MHMFKCLFVALPPLTDTKLRPTMPVRNNRIVALRHVNYSSGVTSYILYVRATSLPQILYAWLRL
jgi:hypothetical protein